PEPEAPTGRRLDGKRDVADRREVPEDAGDLEGARKPEPRPRRGVQRRHVLAGEAGHARVGLEVARELADQRGLARAVGADDRVRLAFRHVEVHPVGRAQAAEALAEPADHDQRLSHRVRSLPAGARTGRAWRRAPREPGTAPGWIASARA